MAPFDKLRVVSAFARLSTRDGAAAARVAHNHEVPGSSPGPATKINHSLKSGCFILAVGLARTWDPQKLVFAKVTWFGRQDHAQELAPSMVVVVHCPGPLLFSFESYVIVFCYD